MINSTRLFIDSLGSNTNGGRCPTLVEPLVERLLVSVQWKKPEMNLKELAFLRFKKGWSLQKLAAHLQIPKTTIVRRLAGLKEK
jgi:hypothetical protein